MVLRPEFNRRVFRAFALAVLLLAVVCGGVSAQGAPATPSPSICDPAINPLCPPAVPPLGTTPIVGPTMAPLPGTIAATIPTGAGAGITTLLTTVATKADAWASEAKKVALRLFWILVAIDLAYMGIEWALKSGDITELVGKLLPKILAVGFFLGIIQNATEWIPDIINGFICAGLQIGSPGAACPTAGSGFLITAIDPGKTFMIGLNLAGGMITSPNMLQIIVSPSGIPTAVLSGLCALLVIVAFAFIAGQLLVALVEAYFVFGAGLVMLGFTGSRWTVSFGEKYIGYAVSMGVKLMTLVLVISLGDAIVQTIAQLIGLTYATGASPFLTGAVGADVAATVANVPVYLTMVGLIGVFMYAAWHIPQSAATLLNGSPSMSLAGVANAAAGAAFGAAGMAAGVAGAGLGMIGGGGGGAGSLAKALETALPGSGANDGAPPSQDLGMASPVGGPGGGPGGGVFDELPAGPPPAPPLALTGGTDGSGPDAGGPNVGGPNAGGPTAGGPNVGGPTADGPNVGGPNADRPNAGPSDSFGTGGSGGPPPQPAPNRGSTGDSTGGGSTGGGARPFAEKPSGSGSGSFFDAADGEQTGGPLATNGGPLATPQNDEQAPWDSFASGDTTGADSGTGSQAGSASNDDVIDAQFVEHDPANESPVNPDVTEQQASSTAAGMTAVELATAIAEALKPKPPSDLDKSKQFLQNLKKGIKSAKPQFVHDGGSVPSAPVKLSH